MNKPLHGLRILLLKTGVGASKIEEELQSQGADVVIAPLSHLELIAPSQNPAWLENLEQPQSTFVFSTADGVTAFISHLKSARFDIRHVKARLLSRGQELARLSEAHHIYPSLHFDTFAKEEWAKLGSHQTETVFLIGDSQQAKIEDTHPGWDFARDLSKPYPYFNISFKASASYPQLLTLY